MAATRAWNRCSGPERAPCSLRSGSGGGGAGGGAQVREEKGLDQVRRDWSPLSKISGRFVLGHILSGAPKEDVVTAIHEHLRQAHPSSLKP